MRIIGITGPLGAGKGAIVDILKKRGFLHFSARDLIGEEIQKRGLEINRDNLIKIANELRAKHSPSYVVETLFERAKRTGKDCVIESVRVPGEIIALRRKGDFILMGVNANQKIRYERILKRKTSTDNISFEKFKEQEETENMNVDPNKQNISACMKAADVIFTNNGSLEELEMKVDEFLKKN